jgi:Terpene synthase family 2, C-terminal metal binding
MSLVQSQSVICIFIVLTRIKLKMLDQEGIKKYVKLYKNILNKHNIIVNDQDLDNIYHLILLISNLDDLYDSILHSCSVPQERRGFCAGRDDTNPNDNYPDSLSETLRERIELEKIKQQMISLMPDRQPIALNSIELVFEAMDEEAHADLSESLTRYLSVCSKSTGAQLVAGYLASKNRIELNLWLSDPIVKFNNETNDIIRLANDYLDVTVDAERMSEEVPQIKAINFFRSKFEFKAYLYYRYVCHKIRYYLYAIGFGCLNIFSQRQDYLVAIECIESVLDLAVKAYVTDKNSFREPGDK